MALESFSNCIPTISFSSFTAPNNQLNNKVNNYDY